MIFWDVLESVIIRKPEGLADITGRELPNDASGAEAKHAEFNDSGGTKALASAM